MENITTEEVMDKLDMFQSRFGKIDDVGSLIFDSNDEIALVLNRASLDMINISQ